MRGLRWGDALVVTLAVALVGSAFGLAYTPGGGATELVVTQAGAAPRHYPLDVARTIGIDGTAGVTTIRIEPGRARCLDSPGSQGICERAGWLERPGDMAVSLPNRLVLQVQGPGAGFDSMHF
ncbi:MAG: NusG domain II-containing protein [Thioalkalivibrio sp.]|nr:MAG: NusG domain II-containing protein [Thioalkalivibrio sp.]